VTFQAYQKYFPALAAYGEGPKGDNQTWEEGDAQILLGRTLPLLETICGWITRTYEVTRNLLCQLSALYAPKGKVVLQFDVSNVHFQVRTSIFDLLDCQN
jgi:hypothetical protein